MSMRWFVVILVAAVFMAEGSYAGAQSSTASPATAEPSSTEPVSSAPEAEPGSAEPSVAPQTTSAPQTQSVIVPAGTAIPLTLVSPIKSRSTKRGDTVRAMVSFPVTTGTQLAITAGTYVQGTVTHLDARTLQNKLPDVEIHFTSMLFANGYAVNLEANSTQARLEEPITKTPASDSARSDATPIEQPAGSYSFAGQSTTPTLPPLPNQPDLAKIAGITMGTMAAAGIGMLVWMHHRATHMDYVLFDSGWQFQMVLTNPLRVDLAQVSAAASTPRAQ